ncbi:MAG: hypothetical protein P8J68_11715 [Arenicellaceae bacterium]|nr:hypothetical protein [Arenicellaceae bacterium]
MNIRIRNIALLMIIDQEIELNSLPVPVLAKGSMTAFNAIIDPLLF